MGRVMRTTDVVEVGVPAEVAWALLEDVVRNPEWQTGMRSCTWTSAPPVRVGSTYDQEAGFAGRPSLSTFKVVDHAPGRTVRITSIVSTFPITVTRTVEPLDDERCRITREVRGEPGGLLGLLAPLAVGRFETQVRQDGERLVALLEAG
jgi:hypothetical protein